MSHSNIQSLKAEDLSALELRLQKAQQAIDELFMAANSDEMLKEQLEAATSPESLVEMAARQGYELTVADLETLRHRTQQQAQLNSEEFDDELSEQELELVAGGGRMPSTRSFQCLSDTSRYVFGGAIVVRNTSSSINTIEVAQNIFAERL